MGALLYRMEVTEDPRGEERVGRGGDVERLDASLGLLCFLDSE